MCFRCGDRVCRYKTKGTRSGSPRLWPCRKMVTSANPEGWWSARYARYEVASRPAEQILRHFGILRNLRIDTRKTCGVAVRQVRVASRPAALRTAAQFDIWWRPLLRRMPAPQVCSLRLSWRCRSKPTATGWTCGVAGKHPHGLLGAQVV